MTRTSHEPEFDELIPELKAWNSGAGIEAWDWIGCVGNYPLAVGYSLIFWPRFVLIEGYVLRHGATEDNLRSWKIATKGDRRAVEAAINHVHMADIHSDAAEDAQEVFEAQLRYLGRTLKRIHEVKLPLDFPDRSFEVSFPDEPGLDVYDYELTFWQKP